MSDPVSVPVLVGELNPYGPDPSFALYDEPENSSGGRLRRVVLGIPRRAYLALPRYNLCSGSWSLRAARARAAEVDAIHPDGTLVLLGRKVQAAFGVPPSTPQFTRAACVRLGNRLRYVLLPHPSGLCREWNSPAAVSRARLVVAEAFPEWSAVLGFRVP